MDKFFLICIGALVVVTLFVLIMLCKKESFFDRFICILVISINVVIIILLIGFYDGRRAMYVDIAISYAVLSFISSIMVAKFLDSKGGDRNNGN